MFRVSKRLLESTVLGCLDHLLVCGDGEEKSNLEELAKKLGISDRVVFFGLLNRVQLAEALSSSEVFLFASENEAMSLVVLESLYMGTPVVSTDVGDVGEAIINGETGYIVKGYDIAEYANRIIEVLESKKESFSEACEKMAERYSPEKMAEEIDRSLLKNEL